MNQNTQKPIHWAEFAAEKIIREKGDKAEYVLASGITPSGIVHFGNFREVITVDFVARALRARGKKVRFIFSWDDYDTFRKIPPNMPQQEELKAYLFRPIVDTPDPYGKADSYAAHHEQSFESQLKKVGVKIEPLYQAQKYRKGEYRQGIKTALLNKAKIMQILNQHRSGPLDESWQPVSIYCHKYLTDKVKNIKFDGDDTLTYENIEPNYVGEEKLSTTQNVKLPWRIDWPMRWAFEKVDFEPGGKDHSSEGGSFTTAKEIVKIFDWEAPVYLQYDFVSIKGAGGKMSSSKGNVITVNDVLDVYEPEIVRFIFASYKSNVDFSISFDIDVIKTYEDYDRQERLAFGVDSGNEKKVEMAKRVFDLSQIEQMPAKMPMQPSFRHLCNLLQINDGDIEKTKLNYATDIKNERDERRFKQRSQCALFWLETYAPDEFIFSINKSAQAVAIDPKINPFMQKFKQTLTESWDSYQTDKDLHHAIYVIMHEFELSPNDIFPVIYKLLINREKGPKLAGFIRSIGKERVLNLLP